MALHCELNSSCRAVCLLRIAGKDARIIHILHDEVIVEAMADIAESVAVTVKNCIEKTV